MASAPPPPPMAEPAPPPPPFLPPDQEIRKQFLKQQVIVESFLFAAFLAFTIILILGRLRPSGRGIFKTVSTYVFPGAAYLVTYVPGLMNQSSHAVDIFALWAAFLAYLAAVANSSSCYTIGDNEDRRKRLVIDYLVAWPLIASAFYNKLPSPSILVAVALIFWIVILKLRERSRALASATMSSLGLAKNTEVIDDFMKYESRQVFQDGESAGDGNRRYLVGVRDASKVREKPRHHKSQKTKAEVRRLQQHNSRWTMEYSFSESGDHIITIDSVSKCLEKLLGNTKERNKLNDTCLSFSMFWLLLAKMAGYDVDAKISDGILPLHLNHEQGHDHPKPEVEEEEKENLERVFSIIESELEFLYDYLYTNSYAIYTRGMWKKVRDLTVIVLFIVFTLPLLVYRAPDNDIVFAVLWGGVVDTGFTRFIIVMIIVIETAQIAVYLTSNWAKVMYICAYIQIEKLPEIVIRRPGKKALKFGFRFKGLSTRLFSFIKRCCGCTFNTSSWGKRKLAQYTIRKSYKGIPLLMWLECWVGSYFDVPKLGQSEFAYNTVTPGMKKAVAILLRKRQSRQLTSGQGSLKDNGVSGAIDKKYLSELKSQSRIILIWHIATSILEEEEEARVRKQTSSKGISNPHFDVATKFSKYCGYLVAFVPKLLPEHVYTAQCEFDRVVNELANKNHDDDEEEEEEKMDKEDPPTETTLGRGRQLAIDLTHENQLDLWKTLAEFWTEMLLFLALTDSDEAVRAHADNLCVGGEFITHLWALLTHMGYTREINN